MRKTEIVNRVLKEAMPMAVYEPEVGQARTILQALRSHFGLETVQKPVWREYITFREGTSNKFHYFVVFDAGDNRYIAANAYGRIGYPAKVVDLGEYPTKDSALGVAMKKLRSKLSQGYQPTSFSQKGSKQSPENVSDLMHLSEEAVLLKKMIQIVTSPETKKQYTDQLNAVKKIMKEHDWR